MVHPRRPGLIFFIFILFIFPINCTKTIDFCGNQVLMWRAPPPRFQITDIVGGSVPTSKGAVDRYWCPAPPKWNVSSEVVKQTLFPQYTGGYKVIHQTIIVKYNGSCIMSMFVMRLCLTIYHNI